MKKYIRDGRIGVLISPGYGIGFSTLNNNREICMDADLIEAHLEGDDVEFRHILISKYNNPYVDENVILEWVPEGSRFIITEDMGRETIIIIDENNSLIA